MRVLPKALLFSIAAIGLACTAEAAPITYHAVLSGPAEAEPNDSPGTGTARVTIDTAAHTLHVMADFTGLLGLTTAAHIHGPTELPFTGAAGVITETPTFPGFPSGVTSGSYDEVLDLTPESAFNPAFLTANGFTPEEAELALADALAAGKAYLNIHSTEFPGGEIRGFLTPIPVPASLPLLLAGLIAIGWAGVSRRSA